MNAAAAAGLGLGERVVPRAGLHVHALPVAREVAVHVEAAEAVLVDRAVTVVVDPLAHGREAQARTLHLRVAYHYPVVGRVGHPDSIRVGHADLRDPAVTVEVLGRILVGDAVLVLVERVRRAAQGLVLDERQVGAGPG